MAQIKQQVGARTALTVSGLSTLAAGTYAGSGPYNCNVNQPLDVVVEVAALTTSTPVGNKQLMVFVQESLDGTNFRSGPAGGTAITDEPNLRWIGSLPMASPSVSQLATFSIAQALGYVPFAFKVVVKNDLGVALTSATVFTSEIAATSV